ncbi:MAG: hypothetical protein ACI4PE_03420 [Bacilli bacterium]
MERISLYRVLKQLKNYKDVKDFYKENEYWFRGHKLVNIDTIKHKVQFDYGLIYYYSNEDYHTVFFTKKGNKDEKKE